MAENINTQNNSNVNNVQEKQEDAFDLVGLLLEYLAQWKWFVISIIIAAGCAYYYISTIVPTYEVGASIFLSDDDATNSSAVSMSTNNPLVDTKSFIDETEIEILKSRNNMLKIVDSLGLAYSYYDVQQLRDYPIYGTNVVRAELDSVSLRNLSSTIEIIVNKDDQTYNFDIKTQYGGNAESKNIKTDKLPIKVELSQGTLILHPSKFTSKLNGTQRIKILNPNLVAARLSGSLNISFAKNSSTILRINCSTPMIREGVDVINTLISFYNQDIIADKNRSAMQTEAFILDRLVLISSELKDVEDRLERYRRVNNITDLNAQAQMNLSKQSDTEEQLAEVAAQQKIIASVEKAISKQDEYAHIPQIIEDAELNSMIDAYNKKVSQLERQKETSTEDNPIIISMQEDLAREKSRIFQNIQTAKTNLAVKHSSIAAIESKSASQLASVPPIDKGLQEIFREQQVKVNIYTFLLQKREEIALQKTLATPTARLIDNPSGSGPVSPKKMTIYGVALLIGFLVPALLIFLRRLIFPIFRDSDDLERVTQVPILGEICIADKKSGKLVVAESDSTPISEMFRLVRNNIQFALTENDKKVILVTSSLSGEGKTFTASNIALSFALTGKRTVVLGMDIRRPVLSHLFKMKNDEGVTTFLSGQVSNILDLVMPAAENENLYVIPGGPVPPNPNELLLSRHMAEMFNQLRAEFDFIIVDSAPIVVVSDSFLIAPHVDMELYVARANYSTKRCLKVMHQAVESGRLPNCYLLLNGVNIKSNSYMYKRYGHYGRYGRKGYGYGYSYSHTEKPTLSSRLKRMWRRASKK